MNLTYRDGIATLLVAGSGAIYWAHLAETGIPVTDSVRGAALAILLLGVGACAVGARQDGPRSLSQTLGLVSSLAFFAGLIALIWASAVALAIEIGIIMVLWAVTTVRHLMTPITSATTPVRPTTKLNA